MVKRRRPAGVPSSVVGLGGQARGLDPRAAFEAPVARLEALQREQAELALARVGEIFFLAVDAHRLGQPLHPAGAAPARAVGLLELAAELAAAA